MIVGSIAAGTLTAIPSALSFTGLLTTDCGTGSATVSVLDGTPPYMAISSDISVRVTPATSNTNPGTFTIEATNPNLCLTGGDGAHHRLDRRPRHRDRGHARRVAARR